MLFILIALVAVGEVLATSPAKPPLKCPLIPAPKIPPKCGPNEYYEICSKPCPPQNCSSLGIKYNCLEACCKPECRCKDGYRRDDYSGKCISEHKCPPRPVCLKENEEYQPCGSSCPDNCDNYKDTDRICTANCVPGCNCKKGYVRNLVDKTCVKPEHCPIKPTCPKNEVYDKCSAHCEPTCENDDPNRPCSYICKPGCKCKDGLVRKSNGKCVEKEKCRNNTKCADPNAVKKECAIAESCRPTCTLPNPRVCPRICNINGCECKPGYVLSEKGGNCIKVSECPKKNATCNGDPNAIIKAKPQPCPSTCDAPNGNPRCKRPSLELGCECKSGYLLSKDGGKCILPHQCPGGNPCGKNATYVSCKINCQNNKCPVDDSRAIIPCDLPYPCPSGCLCKLNYRERSASDDTCILASECSPINCTRPYEKYARCPSACLAERCADVNNQPTTCNTLVLNCQPQCICKKGHYRNDNDICVPAKQCPINQPCSDPHAKRVECAPACQATCEKPDPGPCTSSCKLNGCVCKKGYILSKPKGKCIPVDECPSPEPICHLENEEYQSCGSSCPDNCDNYKDTGRICTANCVPACNCKKGYVRNLVDKTCVKPEHCPKKPTCPKNEVYDKCSAHCEPTCENDDPNRPCTLICKPGCKCKDGLVRKSNGKCVEKEKCRNSTTCADPNAETKKCAIAESCRPTCAQRNPKVCPKICVINGCECKPGYILSKKGGICIKMSKCPPPEPVCLQENEEYQPCGSSCPDNCDNYKDTDRICTDNCVPACNCKKGYVRNLVDKTCVKPEQCPMKCPANEVYDKCSAHCEPTCENDDPNRPCTLICKPGCKCKKGLVRKSNGKCVEKEKCNPKCPINERWVDCVLGLCIPKTCRELGYPVACPGIAGPCKGGCVCIENYLKNIDGICIPQKDCPSCRGDYNATSGCGNNCGNLCSNYDKPNNCSTLPLPCNYNGCDCKDGYVYDPVSERCISAEDCPIPCNGDIYAEKKKCPNPCPPTCAKPNTQICNKACPKTGCQCRYGYILGPDRKCIKVENCPDNLGCNDDPNAIARNCPNPCPLTCENQEPRPCPAICLPTGCECKYGYILSKPGGKCIKPDQCGNSTACADPNAETKECAKAESCRPTCAQRNPKVCPKICVINGCECKPGYILSKKGDICIKISKCPPPEPVCLLENEEYQPCGSSCPDNCDNYKDTDRICTDNCVPACNCKKGYVRNLVDKTCVKPEHCPINQPCSDPNAERVNCAPACRSTCAKPDPGPCTLSCKLNDCVCKKGYILSKPKGKCIAVDQCPKDAPCDGDSNAVIKVKPIPCPSTCSAPNASPYCKRYAPEVGCVCKPGYLKSTDDYDGKCIKPDACPGGNPCGPNGTYVECNVNCPNNKCPINDDRGIIACSPPHPCPSGCACKLNYRKKSHKDHIQCILASDCPPINCTRPNEKYASCPSACLAERCDDINNQPTTCNTLVWNCQPQCICKKGHYRNDKDICVPAKKCPNQMCNDPNADKVDCAPALSCQPTCAVPNPGPCILSCTINGCVCKKGYVLSGGKCTPIEQCPYQKSCNGDPNSVIKSCPAPCPATCATPHPIPCRKACQPVGCECKKGYILSEKGGKCIRPEKCPDKPIKCKKNEVYNPCRIKCPPQTCLSISASYDCSKVGPCEPGCDCISGYLRNGTENDICIPSSKCPEPTPQCDENEVYLKCGTACPPTCRNRGDNCTACTKQCVEGCYCKKGLVRADDGSCINPKHCPPRTCKDLHEIYVECPPSCPATDGCSLLWSKYNCTGAVRCCKPQCRCKPGWYRGPSGACITAKECINPTKCGVNEVSTDCYNDCQRTCKNRIIGDGKVCTLDCTRTGCICKPHYLKHDNGTCVPEDQCSPPDCKKGEVYTTCGSSCPTTCETRGDTCKVCPAVCVKGCVCAGKTIRAPNGTCVDPKKCPPRTCSGHNEHFVVCPPTCPPTENCSNIWSKYDCSKPIDCCKPQCRCKSGYYRNSERICISTEECIKSRGYANATATAVAKPGYASASADAESGDADDDATDY